MGGEGEDRGVRESGGDRRRHLLWMVTRGFAPHLSGGWVTTGSCTHPRPSPRGGKERQAASAQVQAHRAVALLHTVPRGRGGWSHSLVRAHDTAPAGVPVLLQPAARQRRAAVGARVVDAAHLRAGRAASRQAAAGDGCWIGTPLAATREIGHDRLARALVPEQRGERLVPATPPCPQTHVARLLVPGQRGGRLPACFPCSQRLALPPGPQTHTLPVSWSLNSVIRAPRMSTPRGLPSLTSRDSAAGGWRQEDSGCGTVW